MSEVPEVRAAGLKIPDEAKDNGPRMQDLIDPFIEEKSWGRDKTKEVAIRHLGLIGRLLDYPWSVDITGRDVVTFARRDIAEVTEERWKRPSPALINDIQSNV